MDSKLKAAVAKYSGNSFVEYFIIRSGHVLYYTLTMSGGGMLTKREADQEKDTGDEETLSGHFGSLAVAVSETHKDINSIGIDLHLKKYNPKTLVRK